MTYDPNEPYEPPLHPPTTAGDGEYWLRDERRQRNLVIGLSVGAVLVLLVGIIAFAATRSGGDESTDPSVPTVSLGSIAVDPTSSSTTTSTTSTSTTTSTTILIPAVANAGPDLAVDVAVAFTMTALDVVPEAPDAAVRWTQTAGPDVTGGTGSLSGREVVAIAPPNVTTLTFRLDVAGTDGAATDELIVRVFEDADRSVFVDGERGNDAGDGTLESPLRTVGRAVATASGRDVYIRSVGTYDATGATLVLTEGTSLYGGFDANWVRDVARRAVIEGAPAAIRVEGGADRWISAIELTSASGADDQHSVAVEATAVEALHIEDSRIVAGDGGDSVARPNGGASVGILVNDADRLLVERTTVNSGRSADGRSGGTATTGPTRAAGGAAGAGVVPGAGAGDGTRAGGGGGRGGEAGNGANAPDGGAGGTAAARNGGPGAGGLGGAGGRGGDGGTGLIAAAAVIPVGADGAPGGAGAPGLGGRGGGGGFGSSILDGGGVLAGGAGGGGGGGGAGGTGSSGAGGGGGGVGSVGIWATDVERVVIIESLVASGRGGQGGSGFLPGASELGGAGGDGAQGAAGALENGGDGGGAGGGGAGGVGGQGGGGAGGPSYGLLTTRVDAVEVVSSTVRAASGGNGGPGGVGGNAGDRGADGSGRIGGGGGASASGAAAPRGVGASGGSSYGWFDESDAVPSIDDAQFIAGSAGRGGPGSSPGADGVARDTNL